ncbi:programmed cell death protein 1 isoform X1 [Melanerpes formicivorus]|uniref:programmed cell death protein 1 isoform X1 n=1 Tax=Melanerpes formicivorus TaxID=211600 RepID=UPI00358DFADB
MAPGALKTTWGSMEVALTGLCTILLCCGPVLASCCQVTFFPAVLSLPAGSSATFFCNVSVENDSELEYSLNWYKESNHSQGQKIAGISRNSLQTKTEKYVLTNHTSAFKIEILNLHQSDSGSYYCGLITFKPNKVIESNRSHLVVTAAPESTNPTEEPELEEGNPPDHTKAVLLSILLLAGLVVLLVFGYITVMHRRGDVQKPPSEKAPEKEEKPTMVPLPTMDYGVLEFQVDQHAQVPFETCLVTHTEYATIIFPEEKPVTPERGKKRQDERTRQLQLQPC